MKVAVACTHPEPTGLVARRFGRANCFLVYDTASGCFAALPCGDGRRTIAEIGIEAARLLVGARIGAVVAGDFGDSAKRIFYDAHVCLFGAGPVTAARAISEFKRGGLVDL